MYRKLLLALPLASLLFVVGCACNDGTCNTCVSGGSVYAAIEKETPAAEPVLAMAEEEAEIEVADAMTEEEFKAIAKAEPAPAVAAVQSQGYCPSRIPSMPLPEGWQYISESDLSSGSLNSIAHEQDELYSQINTAKRNDI